MKNVSFHGTYTVEFDAHVIGLYKAGLYANGALIPETQTQIQVTYTGPQKLEWSGLAPISLDTNEITPAFAVHLESEKAKTKVKLTGVSMAVIE